eukprot:11187687-Lingulodinium_polyedra.AAC.1
MRRRFRELRRPVYGRKRTLWTRLRDAEREEAVRVAQQQFLEARRGQLELGAKPLEPALVPA